MSGLLPLLDDIAAIAKLAAAQVDDIAANAAKASGKAAGVVIDDSAVTPKYVHGLPAARELPIVWQIARGSLFNKLVILLPLALLLSAFAPWALMPLLMIGGAYLCFEGAEKVVHIFAPHEHDGYKPPPKSMDAAHLESQRVAGAIRTDFILSAEIMTIALASIDPGPMWKQALILAVVAVGITALVYGSVALLVKADDFGLRLSQQGHFATTRRIGLAIVHAMPSVLAFIATIGTAAMLWVGGSIFIHGMEELGWGWIAHMIHDASAIATALPFAPGFFQWLIEATLGGLFGLALGVVIVPIVTKIVMPAWSQINGTPSQEDQKH
ncbi:MAG: hypothetical protein RLZ98_658 [Pseudomonadota bacterium]